MKTLKGIILPIVTPLKNRNTLDSEGLSRLIEHVLAGGVHGIFVLGTTGEAPSLSFKLRREAIAEVCHLVKGRVPVLAGISDTSFIETVNLANSAAYSGADGLVLTAPYYFPAGQNELSDYVDHLMPELPLPLMLYNMPALTKVWFEIETLRQLSKHPNIIGVKDSSGDLDYLRNILTLKKERPDWTFFVGPEHLLIEAMRLGADGGVNGGAKFFRNFFRKPTRPNSPETRTPSPQTWKKSKPGSSPTTSENTPRATSKPPSAPSQSSEFAMTSWPSRFIVSIHRSAKKSPPF